MQNIMGIVLAAGLGKRMKSSQHKVLHQVCGKSMLEHVIDALEQVSVKRKVVVVGHGADAVRATLGDQVEYAFQESQLGTGHAVMMAESLLGFEEGITFVVYGDTPLITANTLQNMLDLHLLSGAAATLLTANLEDPFGLGRIIRAQDGSIQQIVEEKDCSASERRIREVNAGFYCFNNSKLFKALHQVTNHNEQQEYYLTDVVRILRSQGDQVQGHCTTNMEEALGVNDRVQLAAAEAKLRRRINEAHMRNGVTLIDPNQTYIDVAVSIGADTTIWPGTVLQGNTQIGSQCSIGPNCEINDTIIGNQAIVKQSVLNEVIVGDRSTVGPFAYLRPGTRLGEEVKIGDFVELKNSFIGKGSKISHLAYVGDAKVGEQVNIGCGAITVNYDGFTKHETTIEDGAFVGSNVNLIAPVRIGEGAYVVAGSTITHDVPADDMAIARARQVNKPGYAQIFKARFKRVKQ
jgi:bifunctional UDP-N-acetylglucosamine pyrophosphorylase/glucosamine-1-phosphate N-acetyltransferase